MNISGMLSTLECVRRVTEHPRQSFPILRFFEKNDEACRNPQRQRSSRAARATMAINRRHHTETVAVEAEADPPASPGETNFVIGGNDRGDHPSFDPSAPTTAAADDRRGDPHAHHPRGASPPSSSSPPPRSAVMSPLRSFRRRCAIRHAGSVSNLCSATLGAGALSLPYAVSLTGIAMGAFLLLFSAYITVVSIDAIVDACRRTRLFKYEDVSVRLVGSNAGRALEASLLMFCFGVRAAPFDDSSVATFVSFRHIIFMLFSLFQTAVAYIIAVGDILDQGLRSIPFLWESDGFASVYSRERVMVFFWGLVMFPLSLQRHVEALEKFSPVGVLSIVFLVMAAVAHSVAHGDVLGIDDDAPRRQQSRPTTDVRSLLWPSSFWDVVRAFPIIVFAFSCQVNVCAIFEELPPDEATDVHSSDVAEWRSKQRGMARITRKGIGLCATLYVCIGLFGFLDFGRGTADNVLNNYCVRATHDGLMIAASAFVAVAVVVAFPFNILPARVTLKLLLERFRRRRRCRACTWYGRNPRPDGEYGTPMEVDEAVRSPPASPRNGGEAISNGLDTGVTDLLLENDTLHDRPHLIPHMSMEGLPPEETEELYSADSPPLEHFLLTLLLSGSALIVALLIPGISVVFGLMGGTAASIISFILPGMFLMEAYAGVTGEENARLSKRMHCIGRCFVIGGSLMGVLSTGVTIYGLFSPKDTADACGGV